uniref:E3 ubiquitin-protein ligase TTC3/DZIP3 domain-containing protein n=1 Tax=Timema shepardi TaxID=629360 RepID=A0A7R9FW63_TIMSH|nr:unnamed protein product [Timema shepardi]
MYLGAEDTGKLCVYYNQREAGKRCERVIPTLHLHSVQCAVTHKNTFSSSSPAPLLRLPCVQYAAGLRLLCWGPGDPDFAGFVTVICEQKCRIEYHINCWKDFKESAQTVAKLRDKDILGQPCLTTDCVSKAKQRSMLIRIEIVGEDGQIKTFLDIEKKTADTVRESKKIKKKKHEKHSENTAEKNEGHNVKAKNLKGVTYANLKQAMLEGFSQYRAQNMLINGLMMQRKADEFSLRLGIENKCSIWGTLDATNIIKEQQKSIDEEGEEEMEEEPGDIPTVKDVLKAGDVYSRALKHQGTSKELWSQFYNPKHRPVQASKERPKEKESDKKTKTEPAVDQEHDLDEIELDLNSLLERLEEQRSANFYVDPGRHFSSWFATDESGSSQCESVDRRVQCSCGVCRGSVYGTGVDWRVQCSCGECRGSVYGTGVDQQVRRLCIAGHHRVSCVRQFNPQLAYFGLQEIKDMTSFLPQSESEKEGSGEKEFIYSYFYEYIRDEDAQKTIDIRKKWLDDDQMFEGMNKYVGDPDSFTPSTLGSLGKITSDYSTIKLTSTDNGDNIVAKAESLTSTGMYESDLDSQDGDGDGDDEDNDGDEEEEDEAYEEDNNIEQNKDRQNTQKPKVFTPDGNNSKTNEVNKSEKLGGKQENNRSEDTIYNIKSKKSVTEPSIIVSKDNDKNDKDKEEEQLCDLVKDGVKQNFYKTENASHKKLIETKSTIESVMSEKQDEIKLKPKYDIPLLNPHANEFLPPLMQQATASLENEIVSAMGAIKERKSSLPVLYTSSNVVYPASPQNAIKWSTEDGQSGATWKISTADFHDLPVMSPSTKPVTKDMAIQTDEGDDVQGLADRYLNERDQALSVLSRMKHVCLELHKGLNKNKDLKAKYDEVVEERDAIKEQSEISTTLLNAKVTVAPKVDESMSNILNFLEKEVYTPKAVTPKKVTELVKELQYSSPEYIELSSLTKLTKKATNKKIREENAAELKMMQDKLESYQNQMEAQQKQIEKERKDNQSEVLRLKESLQNFCEDLQGKLNTYKQESEHISILQQKYSAVEHLRAQYCQELWNLNWSVTSSAVENNISMVSACKQVIPIERLQYVGEDSANTFRYIIQCQDMIGDMKRLLNFLTTISTPTHANMSAWIGDWEKALKQAVTCQKNLKEEYTELLKNLNAGMDLDQKQFPQFTMEFPSQPQKLLDIMERNLAKALLENISQQQQKQQEVPRLGNPQFYYGSPHTKTHHFSNQGYVQLRRGICSAKLRLQLAPPQKRKQETVDMRRSVRASGSAVKPTASRGARGLNMPRICEGIPEQCVPPPYPFSCFGFPRCEFT